MLSRNAHEPHNRSRAHQRNTSESFAMSSSLKPKPPPPTYKILLIRHTFKTIYLIILIQLFVISSAPTRGVCDQLDRKLSHHHYRWRRHEQDNNLPRPPTRTRVAALATKLDQWLKCYRTNLLSLSQAGALSEDSSDENQGSSSNQLAPQQTNGDTAQVHAKQKPAVCQATFDNHLCWPEARVGQQIRLACPEINFLSSNTKPEDGLGSKLSSINSPPPPTTAINHHHQPPLESVIAAIKLQQDGLGGISMEGNSGGGSSSSGPSSLAKESNADAKLIAETTTLRYARRTCEAPDGTNGQLGRWQTEADYSDCRQANSSSNNLFDPTDEWVALNDDGGQDFSSKDRDLFKNLTEQLERIEPSIDPYSEPDLLEQWLLCIGEVMRQSRTGGHHQESARTAGTTQNNNSTGYCPIIFDGWRCWPATKAGENAYVNCPKIQPGFSAERKAYKICTPEADWYRHPENNRYWSNYTTCVDTVDLAFRTKILNLYVIGNLISLIALAVSLIIFVSFKNLNCTRVTIHKNLFLSFITNNLMWIIWYTYVVNDATLLQKNPLSCRLWHILLHYFLVSNYFWMFCEGLYLHTLLVVTFVSEDKIIKWFYLLGWLTPVPIILTYAYNRSYDDYYTNFCWMEESPHNVILMAPIGCSLLLNLVFLINIVRVLVTKLRANNSPDTHQTRKAVRATLILIPLLGLHYMLTPFRPEAKSEWEVYYEIIAAVCTSFQGLCVAMLFCFCNGEVMTAIKKRLKDSILFKRDSKRTMRSRSNTALSNVFNSVAFTTNNHERLDNLNNNNNNSHSPNQRCVNMFETGHTTKPVCSSSSSSNYGNLMTNELQRQSLIANSNSNNHKQTPNGHHETGADLSSQRTSVMTTITEMSPIQHQDQQPQSRAGPTLNKKQGMGQTLPASGQLVAEEAIKLLCASNETNNNVTTSGAGNEASC